MPSSWTSPESEKSFSWEVRGVSDTDYDSMDDCASLNSIATSGSEFSTAPQTPPAFLSAAAKRLLDYLPTETSKSQNLTCQFRPRSMPLSRPAANITPPEIMLQIFYMLSPRDFDNARRTCSQWMRVSLDQHLLESMLRRAGWWDSWQQDCQASHTQSLLSEQSLVWRMSRRFATECVLSGRKLNIEKAGFLTTAVVDFSKLLQRKPTMKSRASLSYPISSFVKGLELKPATTSKFHVSNCGNYVLITSRCMIYAYRLLPRKSGGSFPISMGDPGDVDITPVASISCPSEVISATIDSSTPRIVVAVLLRDRVGLVCDLVASDDQMATIDSEGKKPKMRPIHMTSRHYFYNVCSTEDPPRSVSICPGRRCVAFGSGSGIELHWVDEKTKLDHRKQFPMSQPSEVLHFLPTRPETSMELRLISSLAGPGMPGCECYNTSSGEKRQPCQFHVQSFTRWTPGNNNSNLSLVRATHCHHYRAVPINDGLHILFIEPRTRLLCIGSDAPIGGPTSLTRALICVPPFGMDGLDIPKEGSIPTVFASGSDLNWGLRVVAAYGDRIILYSVPLDVFNVIRKERERQGDDVMGDSDLARDWFLDNERSCKRRKSITQNQNGDWEFLLSVSYRPTAMMWPFKIYGKEIGRMENVVELALQSSFGGARIWAFGASGETNIIDVDTYTSNTQRVADMPCKSLSIGPDGSIASARLVDRTESGLLSPRSSRKRKQSDSPEEFSGQHSTTHRLRDLTLGGFNPSIYNTLSQVTTTAAKRRASFAACIVDFKIPELGAREGTWVESGCA